MSATNPPRYRDAEDLSGRQRAERRGGITETEFLATMARAGFLVVTNDSPFYTFRHPVLGGRDVSIRPGESFSRMADRSIAWVADMQIVKVQAPVGGSTRDDLWLIYPRGKPWHVLMPRATVPMVVRAVVDLDLKAYFYARRIGDGRVMIFGGQASAQSW